MHGIELTWKGTWRTGCARLCMQSLKKKLMTIWVDLPDPKPDIPAAVEQLQRMNCHWLHHRLYGSNDGGHLAAKRKGYADVLVQP